MSYATQPRVPRRRWRPTSRRCAACRRPRRRRRSRRCCRTSMPCAPWPIRPTDIGTTRRGRCAGGCIKAARSAIPRATPTCASWTASCCRDSRRASGSISIEYASEPEKLYVYLKAYLMLGEPRHLDKKHLQALADLEWKRATGAAAAGASLSTHFRSLLEYSDTLRPIALDPALVAQARSTHSAGVDPADHVRPAAARYSDDTADALRLDVIAGVGIEKVLRRKSGRRLSEPIPGLYTQEGVQGGHRRRHAPVGQAVRRRRVGLGHRRRRPPRRWPKLTDAGHRSLRTRLHQRLGRAPERPRARAVLDRAAVRRCAWRSSPDRPRRCAAAEDRRRQHVARRAADSAAPAAGTPSISDQAHGRGEGPLQQRRRNDHGRAERAAGHARHAALPADPPADGRGARAVRRHPGADSQDSGSAAQAGSASGRRQSADGAHGSRGARPLARVAAGRGQSAAAGRRAGRRRSRNTPEGASSSDATSELEKLYQRRGRGAHAACAFEGRYPFGDAASEMALADFGDVFGYGGLFDKFFTDNLDKLVDTIAASVDLASGVRASRHPACCRSSNGRSAFARCSSVRARRRRSSTFIVRLSNLDAAATRFFVNIDGQQASTSGRAPRARTPVEWPGPDKRRRRRRDVRGSRSPRLSKPRDSTRAVGVVSG